MTTRLFLGCGAFGRRLVEHLEERPGSLLVLTDEDSRVTSLREDGIHAEAMAVEDPEAVRVRAGEVDTVVVAGDDPERNRRLAAVASEAYPDAFKLGYVGEHAAPADRAAIEGLVDRTVDLGKSVSDSLAGSIDESGYRTRRLQRVLRRLDGPLAVVTHDNPDPDAIASAVALERLAERAGVESEVCYYGAISHQENRAFVNLLDFRLTNLDPDADLSRFGSVALVDHSRPGVNDGLPSETDVALVLDHHPPREPVEARFVDLRSNVGATSTLLTDYLRRLELEPNEELATGLLFGIRVDTNDFSREVCAEDFEAASYLLQFANVDTLAKVESPSMSPETLDTIGSAIDNRVVEADVLVSCVGPAPDRDALAQAADKLLDLEGVTTTFVFGYTDEMVYASARARGTDIDLGETLREAFDQVGSAGGHADMAGAQLPIGMLVDPEDERPFDAVREVVAERFFETLELRPTRRSPDAFDDGRYVGPESEPRPGGHLGTDGR
jgi:nanoRNase/pAp phosphatase (c-di-AMP/oligoRNAs hydrolase)